VDLEVAGELEGFCIKDSGRRNEDIVQLRWDGKNLTGIDGPVTESERQRISVMQSAVTQWRTTNERIGEQMQKNTEAAMNEATVCSKCNTGVSPFYRVAEDERLCGGCLEKEHERSLVIQSAYVNYLKRQIGIAQLKKREEAECRACGDTGLISDGGNTVRCPYCKRTAYFGGELGTQEIVGDGNVPLSDSEEDPYDDPNESGYTV
jgi:hypothetical protein